MADEDEGVSFTEPARVASPPAMQTANKHVRTIALFAVVHAVR
jgi:hypothetical protein